MDYDELLFAFHVHMEVAARLKVQLQKGNLSDNELGEVVIEHTKNIIEGVETTAQLIRKLRTFN